MPVTKLPSQPRPAEIPRAPGGKPPPDAAEDAQSGVWRLLATASHEIRTPINAILGYTDLLDQEVAGPLTAAQRSHVTRIQMCGRQLTRLIEDVLDLAKLHADEMRVDRTSALVADAVCAAVALVEPQALAGGIKIRCPEPHALRLVYTGDEDRVRQIVVNLLSNAVKFTEPGGVVTVSGDVVEAPALATQMHGGGPWVALHVADTGIGIPAEEQAAIFHAFVQAGNARGREAGGAGLGLTISRELARRMGGDLTLQSEEGAGSCFTLWLPAGGVA
jgi:signal transduction histidine kinase